MSTSDDRSQHASDPGLPLRGRPPRRSFLASHLVFTGYAHWLANDPRGSGSENVRKDNLRSLGDVLPGRQIPQPPREQVKDFHRHAEPLLEHDRVWFDEAMRELIAGAFAEAARKYGYTLWALAICSNHAHAVPRTHRDRSEVIWANLAHSAMLALRGRGIVAPNHPVWSHRPYKVFLYTPAEVLGRVDYVNDNPGKEGLPRQQWDFVKPCPWAR